LFISFLFFQMHHSVLEVGSSLCYRTVSPTMFGPWCSNGVLRNVLVAMKVRRNYSSFLDKIICRCNLHCRDGGHFHCAFCAATLIRKDAIILHLTNCRNQCDMAQITLVPTSEPPSPETHPAAVISSMSVEHSYSLPPSLPDINIDHPYTQTASPKSPAVAPDLCQSPPATTSEEQVTGDVLPTHIKCPHCPVVLYKRNVFLHIQRKHGKAKDITAQCHLKSTSVDQSNGLYAVRKTVRGFSVPVHMQRKTWGQQHVTRCEMEDCRQYHLLAQRSGLSCPFSTRKNLVLVRKAHVPLSVLVDLTGSRNHTCLSIHEPKLHHYSTLGRVFVTYNTWHCPCAKARASCTHKYIAKCHLFQTHKHLFRTVSPTTTSATTTHSVNHTTAEMERSVRYVYKYKKIPTTLPEEVTARRAPTDFPQRLFPTETTCMLCEDNPKLEEAVQITNKNHVSVSRVISSLETLLKVKFPASDLILQGYCQFKALCNTEYKYSCVNCGFYPPVVVMDLHRKGVFSFEVSELEQPREDFNGEHDIAAFWDSVDLHMISRGFFECKSNPFVVKPKYDYWAPWIGEETRKGNTVLNTEFEKVPLQRSSGNIQLGDLTEDLWKCEIITIVSLNTDRVLTKRLFCILIGGWSVIMCPHGIVYSVKFNLRSESPRDFADLLLSWQHLPNVCVYDFARGLVAHATSPCPFEGRLAEPTKENVEAAGHGDLKVHLPWLVDKLENPESNGHPVTGSREHYVLYDKFHQANTKDPLDVLRRIQIVPELQANLNSQVAEQLFASLRKNNYFLNNMGPSAHIFLMRNILEHRNNQQNEKLLVHQLRRGLQLQQLHNITLSDLGQVTIG
uniref:HMG domain-containing protein n=1 Tax=Myripristis murdjan TaxID=586833 RepID=A0A667YZS3_9TELE